ncbi:MAG: magnesium transporter MgtC [Chloroflexi bacterium HGW-Chloroflexi-6]|nr:MAG: magnesium transporter MgtC [Chloroflexi bacterium HGW-Chloroflexi-6]
MEFIPEEALKLGLAIIVGGLIGAEREFRDKAAGFRTIIFITLGSTLFTIFSLGLGNETNPTRIAANIVTGIGFLGAGAILREGTKVAGLTTAAAIWLSASLGMGLGGGRYMLVAISTLAVLAVLWFFPYFERWIDNVRESRTYEIILPLNSPKIAELPKRFSEHSLNVIGHKEHKAGGQVVLTFTTLGRPENQTRFVNILMKDADVLEFRY